MKRCNAFALIVLRWAAIAVSTAGVLTLLLGTALLIDNCFFLSGSTSSVATVVKASDWPYSERPTKFRWSLFRNVNGK